MSELLWPLFALSAWPQPATVLAGTSGEGSDQDSVLFFGLVQPATVVDNTPSEGPDLASVLWYALVKPASVGGHDR